MTTYKFLRWRSGRKSRHICVLDPRNVVARLVTSQPVTIYTTVTFFSHSDALAPSRIKKKKKRSHHPLRTAHLNTFCVVSHSCNIGEVFERYRGEDAGDTKIIDWVENWIVLNVLEKKICKLSPKILMEDKSWRTWKEKKQNIVMDEELVQNTVMDEELVQNVAMGENV